MSSCLNFIQPHWSAPQHIKAFTTLRSLGNETNWYSRKEDEILLKNGLHLPAEPIWLKQTHSNLLVEALPTNKYSMADASFTLQTNHVCAILTADCLPILLCNSSGSLVAAIHAGWRGLANGIIEKTLTFLHKYDNHYIVWLGPAISVKQFEVGQDVYQAFTKSDLQTADFFHPIATHKWLADLYGIARLKLNKLGIQHIYGGEYCTYTQQDLFYSYRREKGNIGRMASVIWIDK